jgi:long-chain fatty acid transport protein
MNIRRIGMLAAGTALCFPSLPAWSAAFGLQEQSASRLGTAFAGAGSMADDPSTMYFNVAGLAKLDRPQLMVVASAINLSTKFDDDGSLPALGQPLGDEGGEAGGWSLVPSLYGSMPLNDRWVVGIAVNVPFGLVTDYDDDWMGRFQARHSKIETVNIAPSIAWRVTDQLSIGAGINYQMLDATLTNSVNYTAAIAQALTQLGAPPETVAGAVQANPGLENRTQLKGDDEAWGFNVGVLFEPVEGTRLGLSYRSKYKYKVKGEVNFDAPPTAQTLQGQGIIAQLSGPGGPLSSQDARVDLTLPEIVLASITQQVGANLKVMADVSWQRWSRVEELRVVNDAGTTISLTPEEWDNTWRVNLGAEWRWSEQWTFRAGLAYDQSAVPDSTRTPRLPDSDRYWVAIGAQWRPSDAITIDAGYAHLFAKEGPSEQENHTAAQIAQSGALIGDYDASVDILSVQLGYRF